MEDTVTIGSETTISPGIWEQMYFGLDEDV